jgi:hypothetical protein
MIGDPVRLKAFIVPLQVCEVAVRNGVAEAIERVHGPTWPLSNGFLRSLPKPKPTADYNPEQDLRSTSSRQPTTGKVIAELKFAFWKRSSPPVRIAVSGCNTFRLPSQAHHQFCRSLWHVRALMTIFG